MKRIITMMLVIAMVCLCSVSMALSVTVNPDTAGGLGSMQNTVNKVLGAVQIVGYVVAVGMIMYAGIKYLMAGAGEKAKAKDMLVPMAVGAALVALAPTIASWVFGAIG